jgi:hypothetical protein
MKRQKITLRQLELTNKKEFQRITEALIKNRRDPVMIPPNNPKLSKLKFEEKLYLTIKNLIEK